MIVPARFWRFAIAVVAPGTAAGAGLVLQSLLGYRFPLITFYPGVMVSAWYGGFWPGMVATAVSAALVDRLWLAPLRATGHALLGDPIALLLFIGIGLTASAFSESLHRSTTREHAARERAEASERALQERERQLRIALADAEQANHLKDQFVAMVSHELRTPLNGVLGWAEMLKGRMFDEPFRARAVESILANAKRQAQIVDDLLDLRRMVSGNLRIRRDRCDVEEIARAALEIVQPAADAKHIQLSCHAESGLSAVDADPVRLQQVFWNLLSNAIKFTPEHGVVDFRVGMRDGEVEARVSDTGEGIPDHFLGRVFDPFQQGDSSGSGTRGGLGLGLSIVKYLVEAHGGTVLVDSPGIGRGSTFTVRFPVAPPNAAAAQGSEEVRPSLGSDVASASPDEAGASRLEPRSDTSRYEASQSALSSSAAQAR
jgi:signal transduction histidine kinase